MAEDIKAVNILAGLDAVKADFATHNTLCDDVARYFAPEMETLSNTSEGAEILQPIISTGIVATDRLISGIYSNTMSMGKGNMAALDPVMNDRTSVKEGLAKLSNKTHHQIHQSDFPQKYLEWIAEYVNRGAGVMYIYWNAVKRTHEYHNHSEHKVFWTLDANGEVDQVWREYEFSAKQAVDTFGYDSCSEDIRKTYDLHDEQKRFEFAHYFADRRDRDETRLDAANMKYESLHIDRTNKTVVKKSGSKYFRYVIERMYTKAGERPGRCPGMQALPVMRTLLKVVSDYIDGTELALGPPVIFNDEDSFDAFEPKAYQKYLGDTSEAPWVYPVDATALQLSEGLLEWFKKEIETLFFNDLFSMLENLKGNVTAYHVSQLVAERAQSISPIATGLGRFFRKVYYIVGNDLIDSDIAKDFPEDLLENRDFTVKYTSRLEVRLNMIEVSALMDAISQASEVSRMYEESIYIQSVIDIQPAIRSIFEAHNIDPDAVRSVEDAKKELERKLKELKQAQMAESMKGAIQPLDIQQPAQEGTPYEELLNDAGGMAVAV